MITEVDLGSVVFTELLFALYIDGFASCCFIYTTRTFLGLIHRILYRHTPTFGLVSNSITGPKTA